MWASPVRNGLDLNDALLYDTVNGINKQYPLFKTTFKQTIPLG